MSSAGHYHGDIESACKPILYITFRALPQRTDPDHFSFIKKDYFNNATVLSIDNPSSPTPHHRPPSP
jgi:hypothetical protein